LVVLGLFCLPCLLVASTIEIERNWDRLSRLVVIGRAIDELYSYSREFVVCICQQVRSSEDAGTTVNCW
jgi:hypothetical protein